MRSIFAFLSLVLVAPMLQANSSTDEVIAQARNFLGGESALEGITSIYYEAEFATTEGDTGTLKIIFQKPMQQRVEIVRGERGEVTALNGYDGWRKEYDVNDERRWVITMLDAAKIRELRANTWENLNFFRGIESRRGWIENGGAVETDSHQTIKLVFNHPHGIKFTRYFEAGTGRLLMTRTHEGAEIREAGEIRINGVLFPETITMSKDGEVLNEIKFREIKLNEKFDDSLFDVPSLVP